MVKLKMKEVGKVCAGIKYGWRMKEVVKVCAGMK